jgi:hypothetical protein
VLFDLLRCPQFGLPIKRVPVHILHLIAESSAPDLVNPSPSRYHVHMISDKPLKPRLLPPDIMLNQSAQRTK